MEMERKTLGRAATVLIGIGAIAALKVLMPNREAALPEEAQITVGAAIEASEATKEQYFAEHKQLNLVEYAGKRESTEPWLTVELGTGSRPSGFRRTYKGKSAYIGIDANTSQDSPTGAEKAFEELKAKRPDENIFLIKDELIGRTHERYFIENGFVDPDGGKYLSDAKMYGFAMLSEQDAPYKDTQHYSLPDNCADELYCVNTLGDPHSESDLIVGEAARILKPGGSMIIYDRERYLGDIIDTLDDHGLLVTYADRGTNSFIDERFYNDTHALLGCHQTELILPNILHKFLPITANSIKPWELPVHLVLVAQKPI
jgi:SAM-dependent methyltransferase